MILIKCLVIPPSTFVIASARACHFEGGTTEKSVFASNHPCVVISNRAERKENVQCTFLAKSQLVGRV